MKRFSSLIFDVSNLPEHDKLFSSLYGSYPDGHPSGSLLKDEDSAYNDCSESAYMGLTLTATQVSQPPTRVLP